MTAKMTFFPVDNGDMTLVQLDDGRTILIDVNIRAAADDEEDDETPNVGKLLRDRLGKDDEGRYYVDAFLQSHPDQDHCRGIATHFHLGPVSEFPESSDKILIREIWSSPLVFRRASKNHALCEDAKAFNAEARRRVLLYKENSSSVGSGDRVLVLGEDIDGKTDDIHEIVVKVDETFSYIDGKNVDSFVGRLLAPLPFSDDEEEEETLSKNHSSTIIQFTFSVGSEKDAGRYLTCGDAEVVIWERLWAKHKNNKDVLTYDVLLTPHHCSWHSLSHDSWSKLGENAELSQDARDALSQARNNATLISSSKPITDDDSDPPCVRAKREYEDIADDASGDFVCTTEFIESEDAEVLEITFDGKTIKKAGGGGSFTPSSFSPKGSNPPKAKVKEGDRFG
jgi:hypothetical protein